MNWSDKEQVENNFNIFHQFSNEPCVISRECCLPISCELSSNRMYWDTFWCWARWLCSTTFAAMRKARYLWNHSRESLAFFWFNWHSCPKNPCKWSSVVRSNWLEHAWLLVMLLLIPFPHWLLTFWQHHFWYISLCHHSQKVKGSLYWTHSIGDLFFISARFSIRLDVLFPPTRHEHLPCYSLNQLTYLDISFEFSTKHSSRNALSGATTPVAPLSNLVAYSPL